jgi:uncharacterized protein (DUF362 family)
VSDRRRGASADPAGDLSRRHFVAALAAPLLTAACDRGMRDGRDARAPALSPMALLPAASYDVDFADLIGRGLRELGVDLIGRRVLLKPNMVEYEPGTAINTHPLVVAGAVVACRQAGAAQVVVAEGPGHRRDMEYLLEATGLGRHLADLDAPFVDLNHDDARVVPFEGRHTGLTELALPATLLASDFVITMPKLKTHHWAGITCSLKNLFGVVPGAVYGWPKNVLHLRGIHASIVDLAATVRPDLAIVDAVTAMEGDGPIMGRARALGFVAIGTDPVAVDATCARIIGLNPERIDYLRESGRTLGNIDAVRIEQRGERLSRYRTQFDVIPDMRGLRDG